jgi:hypothetical protein
MNLLPLVNRELQVALRRKWAMRSRKWAGGAAMITVVWALMVWGGSRQIGEGLFRVFISLTATAIILMGIFLTSDSISREKREGTLGFLFLTDLQGADIVLGKLVAAAILPASILLALFPGLAICQLAGGVTGGEFWRVIIGLLTTLAYVLTLSLFVSSLCQVHYWAYGITSLLLLLFSPATICVYGLDSFYQSRFFTVAGLPIPTYWLLLLAFLAAIPILLAATSYFVMRGWREISSRSKSKSATPQHSLSKQIEDSQPIVWLMLRRGIFSRRMYNLTGIAIVALFLWLMPWRSGKATFEFLSLLFLLNFGSQLAVLARTAYSFYNDRQDGSLELLLGTRIGIDEVFAGFHRALMRQTAPLLWPITCVNLFSAGLFALQSSYELALVPLAMGAITWITIFGFGWLGVYRSLMTNHPIFAMLATFWRLSFFPMVLTIVFLFAPRTDLPKTMFFWSAANALFAIFFASEAKHALLTHGRTLLLRAYDEKPPEIESELSFINWDE